MIRAKRKEVVPGRIGVLLVNTGTPAEPTPHAVKAYLGRFLMDVRIRPMNRVLWWFILHFFILPKRSVASAEKYRHIWTDEGSPLSTTQERLAHALEERYRSAGVPVMVRHAMCYSEPSVMHAIRALAEEGCERLVALPLYPQSAFSTTGAASDAITRAVRRMRWRGEVVVIDNYHDDSCYVRAIAASIKHAGFDPASDDRLLFSYHSIPLVDVEAGDTYELQTGATSLAVASELGLERKRWTIGYQCQFDKGRAWLTPPTRQTLAGWAEAPHTPRVFMVCPNFAIDCLETLYDIPFELKPAYCEARERATGVAGAGDVADDFVYVPCLNKSKAHVKVLAHVLAPYVGE